MHIELKGEGAGGRLGRTVWKHIEDCVHITNTCTCDDGIPRKISITESNSNKINFQSLSDYFEELFVTQLEPTL
jgi:hypothetical protein